MSDSEPGDTRADAIATLGIVGAGTMGTGIAQLAAQAGIEVILLDTRAGAADAARETLAGTFAWLAGKGKIDDPEAAAARVHAGELAGSGAPIVTLVDLDDVWASFAVREDLLPSLRVGDRVAERVGWSYPDPTPAFEPIRDHIAFYAGPMDSCTVGDIEATPQPGRFYGG